MGGDDHVVVVGEGGHFVIHNIHNILLCHLDGWDSRLVSKSGYV